MSGSTLHSTIEFIATEKTERHALRCICCQSERLMRSPAVLMPFLAKRVFNHEPVEITEEWGLRDIRPGMAYTLCNTLECAICGVIFLDYRFSEYELALLYKDYRGSEYNDLRAKFEPGYGVIASYYHERAAYLNDVESILSPYLPRTLDVLDWGGDTGVNSLFRYKANLLHVYDISGSDVCSEATKVSLDECGKHYYALVTCSQVLEHVPYPAQVLSQIVKIMRPETILYLEVPFEEIFRAESTSIGRIKKRHWHEHINFFSPSSLISLAHAVGLDILVAQSLPVSLGWRDSEVQMLICKLA